MRKTLSWALGWMLLLASGGCAHSMIEGTQVPDTEENREIVQVLRQVREALERRDSAALMALVSTKYFEDNGTPDPRDDYGYVELRDKIMKDSMSVAQEVYLSFELHDVVVREDYAYADIRYATRTRIDLPAGRVWDSFRDFDRLEFVREQGQWRIISGL